MAAFVAHDGKTRPARDRILIEFGEPTQYALKISGV